MKKFGNVTRLCMLAMMLSLSACATSQPGGIDRAVATDFGDSSLEVLFATEFPVASKDEAMAKAALAFRDGEFGKSQFYLVRALKFDVTDVDVLAQIGNLHVMQGNTTLAARAFRFALQQDAEHAASLEGLGLINFRADNENQAQQLLERAIAADATLWRAHNALGVIADRNRDFETAMTHYDRALALQPDSDSVLINRGYSQYLAELYREAALDFYTVAKRSDNRKAWSNLAMVYARQGWYEDSLETYLEVLDPAHAHNEVGAIASANGDFEEAWFFLSEALRLSPTYFASAEKNFAELRRKSSLSGTSYSYSGNEQAMERTP